MNPFVIYKSFVNDIRYVTRSKSHIMLLFFSALMKELPILTDLLKLKIFLYKHYISSEVLHDFISVLYKKTRKTFLYNLNLYIYFLFKIPSLP